MQFKYSIAFASIANILLSAAPANGEAVEKRLNLLDLFNYGNDGASATTSSAAANTNMNGILSPTSEVDILEPTSSANEIDNFSLVGATSADAIDNLSSPTATASAESLDQIIQLLQGLSSSQAATGTLSLVDPSGTDVATTSPSSDSNSSSDSSSSLQDILQNWLDSAAGSSSDNTSDTTTSALSSSSGSSDVDSDTLDEVLHEFLGYVSNSTVSSSNASNVLESLLKLFIEDLIKMVENIFDSNSNSLSKRDIDLGETLKSILTASLGYIEDFFKKIMGTDSISGILSKLLSSAVSLAEKFFSSSTGKNLLEDVISFVSSSASLIFKELLSSSSGIIGKLVSTVLSDVKGYLLNSNSLILKILLFGVNEVENIINNPNSEIAQLVSKGIHFALSNASKIFNVIRGHFSLSSLVNIVKGILAAPGSNLLEKTLNYVKDHLPSLSELLGAGASIAGSLIDELFGHLTGGSSSSGSSSVSSGSSGSSSLTGSSGKNCCCSAEQMKAKMIRRKKRSLKNQVKTFAKRSIQLRQELITDL